MNAIRPPGPQTDEAATLAGEAASETQEILPLEDSAAADADQGESRDFVWSRDEADVLIREQPRTAIYRNPWGAIVIRQMAGPLDEDDSFVWMDPLHLPAVISKLLRMHRGDE